MEPYSFTYLLVVGALIAFADGFGIGANDVANSFSTSVGSRSITFKQAACIAVFTEFLGALLLGSNTSETIRGNIIKVDLFKEKPELLMLAMVCSLIGSSTWVIFASSRGFPVSTTHSIVGAIIGVGVAAFGFDAVDWTYKGVSKIITSWFISPILAGIVASIIFLLTRYFVLRHKENSLKRGLIAIPIYFAFTIAINLFYLVFKGSPRFNLDKEDPRIVVPVVVAIALLFTVFSWAFYAKYLKRLIMDKETGLRWYHVFVIPFIGPRYKTNEENTAEEGTNVNGKDNVVEKVAAENGTGNDNIIQVEDDEYVKKNIFERTYAAIGKLATRGINKEIADYKLDENQAIHDAATKFDPDTERLYSFLQVLTATFASFAHGSNDVANAVGPLAAIYAVYETGIIADVKSPVPIWILALGGIAIDFGLVFYGYHIMRALGNRITYHTPSRGFAMELAASLTVLTASKLGIPVSTTHCITGATIGVGLCNGTYKAINLKLMGGIFFGWLITLPITATVSGTIFAFIANAPR
ncbi:phosphate transporter [Rhizophagus diaphanus]|nr:phosphate transporter [Rhizophagus diaphanus] [Rhizophagus sp. MUCL 43196]